MSEVRILSQILITVSVAIALAGGRRGVGARTFRDMETKPIKSFQEVKLSKELPDSSPSFDCTYFLQNENGRIIDCIDINKQPAFNNPLLTNHKIQMQPNLIPRHPENRNFERANMAMLETVDCPLGTVPIQRSSQQKSQRRHIYSAHGNTTNTPTHPELHYALITANEKSSMPYYGIHGCINVYNPSVSFDQYSESVVGLENRVNKEAVQFGWNVDPELYSDSDTHAFGYWTADGYNTTGCYNTLCDGFIQISRTIMIGARITSVSTYGGKQYVLYSLVYKDQESENWWVVLQDRGTYVFVGYWPASLFAGLASHATDVYLGGAVHSPVTKPPPPMGSGHFIPDDYERTCYISDISFVDASNVFVQPVDTPMMSYSDEPDCYGVCYEGNVAFLNYTVIFGGPGGSGCVH